MLRSPLRRSTKHGILPDRPCEALVRSPWPFIGWIFAVMTCSGRGVEQLNQSVGWRFRPREQERRHRVDGHLQGAMALDRLSGNIG